MAKQDAIGLLFEIDGGSSISSGSGKRIVEQLTDIVNQINSGSANVPKIEFDIKIKDDSLASIRHELESLSKGTDFGKFTSAFEGISTALDKIAANTDSISSLNDGMIRLMTVASKMSLQLKDIFEAIPEGTDGKSKAINSITQSVNDLIAQLSQLGEVITQISQRPVRITNNSVSEDGQELALLRDKALETIKVFEQLRAVVNSKEAKSDGAFSSVLYSMEQSLPKVAQSLANFDLADVESQITGGSEKQINSIIALYSRYNDALRQVVQTVNSTSGFEYPLPDESRIQAASDALNEYARSKQQVEGASNTGQDTLDADSSDQSVLDQANNVIKACNEIDSALSDLRSKIESTFDFGNITPDVSKIVASLNELTTSAENLRISLEKVAKLSANVSTDGDQKSSSKQKSNYAAKQKEITNYYRALQELQKASFKTNAVIQNEDGSWSASNAQYEKRVTLVNQLRSSLGELLTVETGDGGVVLKPTLEEIETRAKALNVTTEQYKTLLSQVTSAEVNNGIIHERNSDKIYATWETAVAKANKYISSIQHIVSQDKQIGEMIQQVETLASSGDPNKINQLKKAFDGLKQAASSADAEMRQSSSSAFSTKQKEIADYYKALAEMQKIAAKSTKVHGSKDSDWVTEDKQYENRVKRINQLREALGELANIKYSENGEAIKPTPEEIETRSQALNISVEQYRTLLDEAVAAADKNGITHEKNSQTIQSTWDKNAAKVHEYIMRLKDIASKNEDVKKMMDEVDHLAQNGSAKNLDELTAKFAQLQQKIRETGADQESWLQKFKSTFGNKVRSVLAGFITTDIARYLRDIYLNVTNLDKAVTDLQIASGKTREETKELIKTYSELGKQLGATTQEVANSADTWLRQGYNIEETNALIQNSMVLSKLGQIDSSEAAKALTSAMKGYKVEVEDSIDIVDKFTAVDMMAAVSAGDIATAMAETATSADIAGVSMDKLVGYIATVAEVTQDGAESVGTFYKTLFARMGNVKVGKFVDDETGESLNDIEATLNNLGVALRNQSGQFRDFGTVLDEVAANWENYDSVSQHALATAFAGKTSARAYRNVRIRTYLIAGNP